MAAMDEFYLLVAIGVLTIAFGAVAFGRARRAQDTVLSRISSAAGGSHRGPKGSATLASTRFTYQLVGQGKGAPPGMLVSVEVASGARFQVKKKNFDSKVFHAIGLSEMRGTSAKVPTGDAEFDDGFFLVCDSVETGRRIFSLPHNRDAARRILERGYNVLKHDGECVAARVSVTNPETFAPRIATEIVPLLAGLAASIRENARPAPTPVPAHILWPRRIAITASALFAIAAVVGFAGYMQYRPLDGRQLALASLTVSLPVAALVVLVLWMSKRTALLSYLVGALLALPLIAWWGGGWLNGYLDRGPPTVHVVPVLGKRMAGDYPHDYYVTLASWRSNRARITLNDERLFGVVQAKRSLVAVTTMPGFFGFEWISSAVHHGPAPAREPTKR